MEKYIRAFRLNKSLHKFISPTFTWARLIVPSYSQQNATFFDLFIYKHVLHVSGGSSAHHQEHTTVKQLQVLPTNTVAAPETCRASLEINKSRNVASCWL
jgi:hypothetical protein